MIESSGSGDYTFVPVTDAWAGANRNLAGVIRIAVDGQGSIANRQLLLADFSGISAEDLSFDSISRDLQLLQEAVLRSPEKLRQVIESYTNDAHSYTKKAAEVDGGQRDDWDELDALLTELRLNEAASIQAGGGILPLILVAVALGAGCAHTNWAKRKGGTPDAGTK